MSRIFYNNMKLYLDSEGKILPLAKKTMNRAEHLGAIVEHVTEPSSQQPRKGLFCWNKINRKACNGMIDACIDTGNFHIHWHCLKCGDHGSISHWEHTLWDKTSR